MNDLDHAGELLSMAGKDLKALRGMTDTDTFAEEVFGFHAQQTVEKALKAWVAALGEEYPLTHSIATLLSKLDDLGRDVAGLWDLTKYNAFAVQLRYEVVDVDEPPLDRQTTIASVQALFDRVRAVLASLEKK